MRSAEMILLIPLFLAVPAFAQTGAANPCIDLGERKRHEPDVIDRDVEAFDVDKDRSIDAEEFRNYLLACDQRLAGIKAPQEREDRITDLLNEIVETFPDSVMIREDRPGVPLIERAPISIVKAYAQIIDGHFDYSPRQAKERGDDEPKPSFTFGRDVLDARNPFASDPAAVAPFLIAYKHDREAEEESGILLGRVGYGPWTWGRDAQWQAGLGLNLDVDTAKGPEQSSITFAPKIRYTSKLLWQRGDEDNYELTGYWLTFSPQYQTDGNGDRDVVSFSTEFGVAGGRRLLYANRWLQAGGGRFRSDKVAFRWSPLLKLKCGDVRDDGGNARLAEMRAEGGYCRAHHALEAVLVGANDHWLDWEVRLTYEGVRDLSEHWNRNYTEFEVSAARKLSPIRFLLLYRRGRPEPTFESTDEFLVGFGIRK